jgi:GGDEF domain-containing protein
LRAHPRTLLLACSATHILVSLILVITVFRGAYTRIYHQVASVLTPFRAAAFAVIVAAIVKAGDSGTSAMTVNMFGLMFFSGLLLRHALPSAVAMTTAFIVALASFHVPAGQAVYSMTSLLIVFGLAGFVAWDSQCASRQAFLEHGLTRADATRDGLTGLVNRRHFDARLAESWQVCGRAQQPLTLMLIDVDRISVS